MLRTWVVGAAALGAALVASPAAADPATANSIQIGVGFRYGFDMEPGELNQWGTGLGLDGGYTLPNAVYVGGNFEYFFGESLEIGEVESSGNLWQLTAEGGYDIGIGPIFVLRPKVGMGVAGVSAETCDAGGVCVDDASTDFVLAPGGTFILMPPGFSLSLDVRYDVIFAERTLNAVIVAVGIGF
jgi:hypothetical protein